MSSASVNGELEALLAADQQLNAFASSGWSKDAWNGLVMFGRAPPARCWGADQDVSFDIAVVGEYTSWGATNGHTQDSVLSLGSQ
jgi:hypothetical protein